MAYNCGIWYFLIWYFMGAPMIGQGIIVPADVREEILEVDSLLDVVFTEGAEQKLFWEGGDLVGFRKLFFLLCTPGLAWSLVATFSPFLIMLTSLVGFKKHSVVCLWCALYTFYLLAMHSIFLGTFSILPTKKGNFIFLFTYLAGGYQLPPSLPLSLSIYICMYVCMYKCM